LKKSEQPSHREMRMTSIRKIVSALRKGIYTKNGIVEETNLSWGSCSSIINLLHEKEIILIKDNKIGEGRGRKTAEYHFNNQQNLLFGMEIREDEILCSIINWGEEEISRHTYPIQDTITHSNIVGLVSSAYITSLIEIGIRPESIIGLSIALAGGVDVTNKRWLFAPRIKAINSFNFNQLFKVLPAIPYTFIEHDIHAQATSVIRNRNWTEDDYVFLHIGSGISMSIYNKGLYLGNRGFAGEIGHIPYSTNSLGNEYTSIESAISTKGLINYINRNYSLKISCLNDIPDQIRTDNSLLDYVYNAVKFTIIVTSNILDPRTLILGGSVVELFYPTLIDRVEKEIKEVTWAGGPQNIRWYKNDEMYGALGTILNASETIITAVIEDKLV